MLQYASNNQNRLKRPLLCEKYVYVRIEFQIKTCQREKGKISSNRETWRERTVPEGTGQEVVSRGSREAGGPALDGQDPTGQTGCKPRDITPQLHPTVTVVMKPHSAEGRDESERKTVERTGELC